MKPRLSALLAAVPLVLAVSVSAVTAAGSGDPGKGSERNRSHPLIVAHRAGTADYPENTLVGVAGSLRDGADALWLTVQVSSDGVPVLYRPADLSALTNGSGPVAGKTAAELTALNAGWNFKPAGSSDYPYRTDPAPIPTLAQALAAIPAKKKVFLDLKQTPAAPLVDAVNRFLKTTKNASRVVIYSTDAEATSLAGAIPGAAVAESRDRTRQRLIDIALAHKCDPKPAEGTWLAFEFHRKITVTETFTLGSATTETTADLWDRESMKCIDPRGGVNTMAIAINTEADYDKAAALHLDAVLVDSPATARTW